MSNDESALTLLEQSVTNLENDMDSIKTRLKNIDSRTRWIPRIALALAFIATLAATLSP